MIFRRSESAPEHAYTHTPESAMAREARFAGLVEDVERLVTQSKLSTKDAIHLAVRNGEPNLNALQEEELSERLRRHFSGEDAESEQTVLDLH